ncbi:Activator of Hsp90 ATPase homolog 1-like protein [Actinacidiphila yanglinensis]|uniref:Activator of Hsp90 ATPase homolog 1-like protein n=2 Tax=Actinacidiphila yanglinensis TaxID=310779 RepID=A0A1H5Y231_9ACTN|nr:Activator of Hsp90 ATPase homolog 1-like protein [Actinacidiphila yanglinensis]
MMTDESSYEPVAVSRLIPAPAAALFRVLANPARHTDLDGSGMLRGAVTETAVARVGDVFVMGMYHAPHGHYEMNNHVVEFEQDRRIAWEPEAGRGHPDHDASGARWGHRWTYSLTPTGPASTLVTESYDCSRAPADERAGMRDGQVWIGSMEQTLERLEEMVLDELSGAIPGDVPDDASEDGSGTEFGTQFGTEFGGRAQG